MLSSVVYDVVKYYGMIITIYIYTFCDTDTDNDTYKNHSAGTRQNNYWPSRHSWKYTCSWFLDITGAQLHIYLLCCSINSSHHGQDDRHFTDDFFIRVFVNEKFCSMIEISLKFVPKDPVHSYTVFGLDNGLAPNRRQAIIWTNAHPIHWRIYALGGDELIWISHVRLSYLRCQVDDLHIGLPKILTTSGCFARRLSRLSTGYNIFISTDFTVVP